MHKYMSAYIHTYLHACNIYVYMHVYMHTCLHTNIHHFSISGCPDFCISRISLYLEYGNTRNLEIQKSGNSRDMEILEIQKSGNSRNPNIQKYWNNVCTYTCTLVGRLLWMFVSRSVFLYQAYMSMHTDMYVCSQAWMRVYMCFCTYI